MKYRINRNQEPLTDGELASARNFGETLKGYQSMKIPFYRRGKFLTGGSAVIFATVVTLMLLFDDKGEILGPDFISPPLARANIVQDSYTVDADSATTIDYKSGSKIQIPAKAFKDEKGNMAKGKVILKYREFHDQKDIFLSGIPMIYDSAGNKYVFESAGMMEITASQDGKALTTNPDKPIKVDMVSNTAEDRYNTYYLDTVDRKWVNLNQSNLLARQQGQQPAKNLTGDVNLRMYEPVDTAEDAVVSNPALAKYVSEVKKTSAAVTAIEKEKPSPIVQADKSKTKFHIVLDSVEFPELSAYKGIRFQVKDEKNFDAASARVEWEDVKLKKLTGMDYEVTFSKGSRIFKVIATPVVDDKNLAESQKLYDKKFAQYESKLTDRKAAEEKARQEYEARAKEMEAQMQKALADQKERDRLFEASLNSTQLVYRTFSVYRFGTYNCDSPVQWPTESNVVASLTNENGDKINLHALNLIEKDRNAIFPYIANGGECKNFKFNGSKDNLLWAVTDDNKLAIVDAKSFKAQQNGAAKVQFRFKIVDKDFKSSEEVKKYLEI